MIGIVSTMPPLLPVSMKDGLQFASGEYVRQHVKTSHKKKDWTYSIQRQYFNNMHLVGHFTCNTDHFDTKQRMFWELRVGGRILTLWYGIQYKDTFQSTFCRSKTSTLCISIFYILYSKFTWSAKLQVNVVVYWHLKVFSPLRCTNGDLICRTRKYNGSGICLYPMSDAAIRLGCTNFSYDNLI